ncbi:hypothetical protein F383_20361 [Gossypium arboreum]|uniref:Uncharacterized protein n=1 Tax=Gossypium arboreum TaxID=29729 RepID=A0A0B0NKG7_GOSAR|nr:hypothetical protein F383_20361 [Gossypium arboreum]
MSQTWSYTSSSILVPMPCPRHGLTLAYVSSPMHVPDMSYTSARLNANAMS